MTVYGASKLAGEAYTRAFWETYRYPTVVLRPFNAYGPRCHHEGDSGEVIPEVPAALPGRKAHGHLRRWNADARFHLRQLIRPAAFSRPGFPMPPSDKPSTWEAAKKFEVRDLANTIAQVLGRPQAEIMHVEPRPGDVLRLLADSSKARKLCSSHPPSACATESHSFAIGTRARANRRKNCWRRKSCATGSRRAVPDPCLKILFQWRARISGRKKLSAAGRAILSGWVTQGPEVAAFEREFAAFVGAPHACAVSSGTTALHLALLAVGVQPGRRSHHRQSFLHRHGQQHSLLRGETGLRRY